jgi:hypothetical protein
MPQTAQGRKTPISRWFARIRGQTLRRSVNAAK